LFLAIDRTIGLRPGRDAEREGLDINEHGERAYNLWPGGPARLILSLKLRG
jgi:ammonia channel protein AmtB